jgi:hypothetical protein
MPGPAPNPNAIRRNNRGDWRTLPARCDLEAPAWPLPGRATRDEADLWAHLWTLPQAVIWHEQRADRLVARYVRLSVLASSTYEDAETGQTVPGGKAADQAVVIRLEDGLLLTPDKLLKARCVIAADGQAAPAATGTDGGVVVELDEYRDLYG